MEVEITRKKKAAALLLLMQMKDIIMSSFKSY